jgi:hypothetical protein
MSSLDNSYARAVALVNDVEPRLDSIITEEDAKVQLVVRILTEVLGWHHADLSTERKNDNGFSDFIVSDTDGKRFLSKLSGKDDWNSQRVPQQNNFTKYLAQH